MDDRSLKLRDSCAAAEHGEARSEGRMEHLFQHLLEAAPDSILETDRDSRILLMNAATERLFGYSREELSGQNVRRCHSATTHVQENAAVPPGNHETVEHNQPLMERWSFGIGG